MRKSAWVAALGGLAMVGALLVAPQSFAQSAKEGGTLTVGVETDARGFDAVKGGVLGASAGAVAMTIGEPLIVFDRKTGKYLPNLAVSWSQSQDLKSWTFKLRKGVKFHDGSPFTAKDAADHMNRILDPKNKSRSRSFITAIKKAVVVDSHTIRYELAHPWIPFLGAMAGQAMVGLIPSHKAVEAETQNRHPIGTGPFKFKSWAGGDRIVVERNRDYWNKGKAHLDRIVFRIMPDTQARFASLRAGEVDVIWTDRGNSILRAQKDPNIVVVSRAGKGGTIGFLNTSKPPLDDARVRQALSHAWNQQAMLNVVWKNTVPFARHPFGEGSKCAANYREYDPDRARQLIAEYGKPVNIELIHTTTARGREFGGIMQQLYKKIGVNLKLVPVDQNTLVKKVFTNDYMISGWRIADANDVGPQLFALSYSKSRYNLSRFKNEMLDKVSLGYRTAPTQEKRDALGCKLVQMINDSGHMLYGGGNKYYVLTGKNVRNVSIASLGRAKVAEAWKTN